MADQSIEWVLIDGIMGHKIGVIGFIGGKAAIVAAFYDDRDGNEDGNVSWGEAVVAFMSPIKLDGRAITEVAMAARTNLDVIERDASFGQEAMRYFLNFASDRIKEGLYTVYLSRHVKAAGTGVAQLVTGNAIKQFVVRKGFEKAVQEMYEAAVSKGDAFR